MCQPGAKDLSFIRSAQLDEGSNPTYGMGVHKCIIVQISCKAIGLSTV